MSIHQEVAPAGTAVEYMPPPQKAIPYQYRRIAALRRRLNVFLATLVFPACGGGLLSQGQSSGLTTTPAALVGDIGASVAFQSYDESGCILRSVFVEVFNEVTLPGHQTTPRLAITLDAEDTCKISNLISAFGDESSIQSFSFSVTPSGATLNLTAILGDINTSTSFPISISLTWAPTGPPQINHAVSIDTSVPGTRVVTVGVADVIPAQATGTVTSPGTPFVPLPGNLAPQPSSFLCNLLKFKAGTITITTK